MPRSLDDVCTGWSVVNGIKPSCIHPKHGTHIFIMINYHCFPQSPIFQAHRIVIDRSDKKQFEVKTIGPSMHVFLEDEAVRSQSPSLQDENIQTHRDPMISIQKSGIRFGIRTSRKSILFNFWTLGKSTKKGVPRLICKNPTTKYRGQELPLKSVCFFSMITTQSTTKPAEEFVLPLSV